MRAPRSKVEAYIVLFYCCPHTHTSISEAKAVQEYTDELFRDRQWFHLVMVPPPPKKLGKQIKSAQWVFSAGWEVAQSSFPLFLLRSPLK
ncbi:hypothetical protein V6N13_010792 [Hibiscus sabdariffa]